MIDGVVAVCPRTLVLHADFRARLGARARAVRWNESGERLDGDALVAFLDGATHAVVGVERVDAAIARRLATVRTIAKLGVGLDNLDLDALERAGIAVGWTPGVNRRAVAELVLGGTLALLRGLPTGDRAIREGALASGAWRAEPGRELRDETLGVIGCGHVGLEVARVFRALGVRVLGHDVRDRSARLEPLGVPSVSLERLLDEASVVSLHVPLDASTRHLLDRDRLGRLPRGAVVVNAARGGVVDEVALLDGLEAGRIAGAFLDVREREPAAPDPLALHPRVLSAAHVGGSSARSIDAMADAALRNLELAGPVGALRARLAEGRIEPE